MTLVKIPMWFVLARLNLAIADILSQSPSLKNYVSSPELFQKAFADSLKVVRKNEDYSRVDFPDVWHFSYDIYSLLNVDFWGEQH